MTFSSLIGNDLVQKFLEKVARKQTSSQVFLFAGPQGVGKKSFALSFAELLLGEKHVHKLRSHVHPDLLTFQPEGKTFMHPIASIRKILEEASLPPFEAALKVYIIEDVERMLPSSSNALLKTLEEPHPHLRFILLTSHPEEVLPTISSRCCKVPFYPIPEEEIRRYLLSKGIEESKASQISLASHGSLAKALQLVDAVEDPIYLCFLDLLKYFLLPLSLESFQILGKLEKLLEKKIDTDEESGALIQKMDELLEALLFWLRDLHLIKIGQSSDLFFSEFRSEMKRQISIGKIPSLEKASLLIEEARMGLQRSMKPKVVLEHLFFKLTAS